MGDKRLLIRGGTVVTDEAAVRADVLIRGEQIAAVGEACAASADEVIDAGGLLVLPGGLDPHVHISRNNSGKADDFYTGSLAALAGGTTSVIDFCEADADETTMGCIRDRMERGLQAAVDYTFHFTFTERYREELRLLPEIRALGLNSFKAFTCYENTTLNLGDFMEIFPRIRDIGPILIHSEDEAICRACREQLRDAPADDFTNCCRARPALAEELCVQSLATLAERFGVRACIAHLSTAAGLAACRGVLNAETCPHYLTFTQQDVAGAHGVLYTMTPPLRTDADRQALWAGLLDGRIRMFSTDHCAFPRKLKERCTDWTRVPNGVGGIRVRMEYLFSEGVGKRGMPLTRYAALTSANAARFYGLYPRKGTIRPGADADLVLLDPNQMWTLRAQDLHGAEDHSLYENMELRGKIRTVISRGARVYENGTLRAERGRGRYLPR